MKTTCTRRIAMMFVLVLLIAAPSAAKTKAQKQAEVRQLVAQTLAQLYKARPSAKPTIKAAAGYAVFSSTGVKIGIAGSGRGKGMAVNNKTRQETFMKMLELQAGLGMGVKKFRVVFVFETEKAFNSFVDSGWQFGGQSTAAAKVGGKGGSFAGAASVSDGVWMYQLTDKGLALEITAKGSKYYKDDDLN